MQARQLNIFFKRDTTKIIKKPISLKLEKNYFWCPYCGIQTKFVKDQVVKVKKCPGCGISENDYWVRCYAR